MPKVSLLESITPGWSKSGRLYIENRLAALGFPHGVTTRALGNMKLGEARAEALKEAGLRGESLILNQVHGTTIVDTSSVSGPNARPTADGWVTTERGAVPAVYVADCLPIFVWDVQGSAAGVFHAGWRGVSAGMPRAAVLALRRFGLGPERLAAAIGPHVGACCYSVGPEVAERFRAEVLLDGRRLDLGAEARLQLIESGLASERVSVSLACTACCADEFFSYRREKLDQRLLAFIALPGSSHGS